LQKLSTKAHKAGFLELGIISHKTPIDNESIIELIKHSQNRSLNLIPIAHSCNNNKLTNISKLKSAGAKMLYLESSEDANIIKRVFEYSKLLDIEVLCFAQDKTIANNGVMNESNISSELGLRAIAELSEIADVAKVVEIAKSTDANVIISNITTKESIEIITRAKKSGVNIKAQVSIHHLLLDDTLCLGFNTYAKINPPLRSKDTQKKLLDKLVDNEIDLLSSMHYQVSKIYKDLTFDDARFAIDSIDEYFSIAYTNLVKSGIISLSKLSQLISYKVPTIKVGNISQYMIIDKSKSYKVTKNNSLYKNQYLFGSMWKEY
jgi:dihydroorotase